jgi:hypothetical protein
MLVQLSYRGVKVRCPNSGQYDGDDKFTGTKSYQVDGTLDGERIRLSLGTEEKSVAVRRVSKLERAVAEGSSSPLWLELSETLPRKAFSLFADRVGYLGR